MLYYASHIPKLVNNMSRDQCIVSSREPQFRNGKCKFLYLEMENVHFFIALVISYMCNCIMVMKINIASNS